MTTTETQIHSFDVVEQVVSDSLRFRRKLAIGADAYATLRIAKNVQQLWDVGGVAATGAGMAASSTVASTFFASTGWLATIGFGAAATTPIGWIVGAAVASGSAYYGVTRLFQNYGGSKVETIPKFINTPIDLLGASLLDFIGAFAIKIAVIDGNIDENEISAIKEHFVEEWGFDPAYTDKALQVIIENSSQSRIDVMVRAFASFAKANPDCNFHAITTELVALLHDVAQADGVLDEREELAIEKFQRLLADEASISASMKETASMAGRIATLPLKIGSLFSRKKAE